MSVNCLKIFPLFMNFKTELQLQLDVCRTKEHILEYDQNNYLWFLEVGYFKCVFYSPEL